MPLELTPQQRTRYALALDFAQAQIAATVQRTPDYFPCYSTGGVWRHPGELWTDWTGGFFAGAMWRFHRRTGEGAWRERAEHYSRLLEHRQHDRKVHDLGFVFLNTYRPWFELTGESRLQDVLVQAGRTLAMRFQERGGYLCSFIGPQSLFIDIMMNVPIIYYAANVTGDPRLREVADTHCRTTRDTIVRDDGSTAHEGEFDLASGEFLGQTTHQGLRGDSRWARGLAWSLYGYSQCYELTGDRAWLDVAQRNAAFWLTNLPADGVPWWDFDADLAAPLPWGPQKDSSAAAIASSGLIHLAEQVERARLPLPPGEGRGEGEAASTLPHPHPNPLPQGEGTGLAADYRRTALRMLDALSTSDYLADQTPGWEGILRHGVYHTAKGLGVDESVMWGDFFYVEALSKAFVE